jgi:hypothetical protein
MAGSRPPLLIARSTGSEHYSISIRKRSRHTPRRADAAPLSIARSTDSEHCSIFIRNRSRHAPRRADARRSCAHAFVHRKRRYFAGDRAPCMAPRAGGVSPPWVGFAVTNRKRTPQAICRACNQERGASAPVARERSRPGKKCATASAFRFHGGLTGDVLVGKNCAPLARRFRSHGGLTPAALVNVRLCIAKGDISLATGHRARRQERGASAPRGKHPPLRIGNAHRRRYVAHAIRSGGRKPGVGVVTRQQCPIGYEQLTDGRYLELPVCR